MAALLAGTALALALPFPSARAQSETDEIILEEDSAPAEPEQQGAATKLNRIVVGTDNSAASVADVAAPVSAIDAEAILQRFSGDLDQVLRSTPGAFTREVVEQPGIVVNVRGMQGMGRVNTMIDGVPQNVRNLSGHSGTFDNMAYVDANMLAGVDITRGAVSGAEGVGTLSGAANFRTLGIQDVLLEGRDYGGLMTLATGTNGYNFSRLTAGGWRHTLGLDGSVSLMGAISGTDHSNFRNGDGIDYPYDASQHPRSGLVKFNLAPDSDHTLELGGVFYENAFAVESAGYDWQVRNQTYTAKYAYQPGDNIFDLKINAYMNVTDITMTGTDGVFDGREGTDTGLGFDISNASTVDLAADTSLKLFYGGAINSDQYEGNSARGANPDGTLIKSGLFGDATLTNGMFGVTAGLRYDAWRLSGVTENFLPGTNGCPVGGDVCAGESLTRDGGNLNPKLGLTLQPTDWLQFYGTYAYTMRPPTASEMFYPGGHNFDGSSTPIQNNPSLLPERQRGLDLGVNLRGDDLFTSGDQGFVKLGYFRNRISSYITFATDSDGVTRWINLPGTTVMQGVELQAGYDIGVAYTNLSVTVAETRQPLADFAGIGNDVGRLPDDFATLDAGMRFLDQALTVGGRVRYTGDSILAFGTEAQSIQRPSYTLVDLYGSWKFNENFKAFFSVENVLDTSYWTANSGTGDAFSTITSGRGRTIMIGATARF